MKHSLNRLLLSAILLLFIRIPAFAWGFTGHHIVAEVAKRSLSQNIIDSVQKYLGEQSFSEAATWMDEVRKDPAYDYMKTWHYVNVEQDKTYVKNTDANIVNELERVINELHTYSKLKNSEIKTDLDVLFHLMGDLHMPLHAGYASDKGGNSIQVESMGSHTNLHRVWDTDLIEMQKISVEDCLKYAATLSPKERKDLLKDGVIGWMTESRNLLGNVYSFQGNTLDDTYIHKSSVIVLHRLTLAGLRLAEELKIIFGGNPIRK
jgi:hypothetical protein